MGVYQNLYVDQVKQSIADNTSTVRIKWTSQQTGDSRNGYTRTAYYYTSQNGGAETRHSVSYTLPGGTTQTIVDTTITVPHNSDGTGSIKVRTWMDTDISAGIIEQTKTLTLSTIPRASSVSAPNGELGKPLAISIDRKSSSFSDKLYYRIGSADPVLLASDVGASYSWTPPVDLAVNAPNSEKLSAAIIVNTFKGGQYIGRSEISCTLNIPASVAPTLAVELSDFSKAFEKYGGYVQLRSRIKVQITAEGAQGSTIKSYSIKVGDIFAATSASGTTDLLPESGSLRITCAATDSRGRTKTNAQTVDVLAYSKPAITAIACARCNADGTVNRAGAYGKVTFSGAITPLSNINTAAYTVQCREVGAEEWTNAGSAAAGDYAPTDAYVVFPADKTKRLEIRAVATDAFESIGSSVREIPAAYALYHLAKHLISVGIGRLCDKANALQVGFDAYFDKNMQIDGTTTLVAAELETPTEKVLVLDSENKVLYRPAGSLIPDLGAADYIVEQGTTGVWTWCKWYSGLAECWGIVTLNVSSWHTWGTLYTSDQNGYFSYPGIFVAAPVLNANLAGCGASGFLDVWGNNGTKARTPTMSIVRATSVSSAVNFKISLRAVGRWKE